MKTEKKKEAKTKTKLNLRKNRWKFSAKWNCTEKPLQAILQQRIRYHFGDIE